MYRFVSPIVRKVNFIGHHLNNISSRFIAKDVQFGQTVRSQMLQGVDILANAVALTMGPKGRNVILEQTHGPPKITKDGVTVAKSIILKNKFQNIGAKLVQNVAIKTNQEAGDGTSTATILARAIAKEGFDNILKGANPIEIRKGVMLAVESAKEQLNRMSKPIKSAEEIEKIATISSNGDELMGKLIASAFNKVGKDGVVTIKTGKGINDVLEVIEGIKFDNGFVSPYFINSFNGPKVEYDDALVLFCQKKIFTVQELIPTLEVAKLSKTPIVIIAEDFDEEPLSMLIVNKLKGGLPVVAVKAPGFGDNRKNTLIDMAVATGGVVFEDDLNLIRLEDCQLQSLGKVGELTITKDTTLLLKGRGDKIDIEERIEEIKKDMLIAESELERVQLIERLCRLQSGVAVLHVGGYSDVEINEKKERINDALNATRAAISEGVVAGGGSAFVHCIRQLKELKPINADQAKGVNIVMDALRAPCATIANNAGYNGSVAVSKIEQMESNIGFDAVNIEFVDMFERGIIDPTKIVKQSLIDGSGIASLLTTAEAVICDMDFEKESKWCVEDKA